MLDLLGNCGHATWPSAAYPKPLEAIRGRPPKQESRTEDGSHRLHASLLSSSSSSSSSSVDRLSSVVLV
eukprot:2101792-Pyramimonas_sp.AAC.1